MFDICFLRKSGLVGFFPLLCLNINSDIFEVTKNVRIFFVIEIFTFWVFLQGRWRYTVQQWKGEDTLYTPLYHFHLFTKIQRLCVSCIKATPLCKLFCRNRFESTCCCWNCFLEFCLLNLFLVTKQIGSIRSCTCFFICLGFPVIKNNEILEVKNNGESRQKVKSLVFSEAVNIHKLTSSLSFAT